MVPSNPKIIPSVHNIIPITTNIVPTTPNIVPSTPNTTAVATKIRTHLSVVIGVTSFKLGY